MELALSWMSRYVGPTPSSWGGAMGCGGSVEGCGGEGQRVRTVRRHSQQPDTVNREAP